MLKIDNLQITYGSLYAVQGVSLEVPEGQLVALVGGNGSGKTSLLQCIAGLIQPLSGEIIFAGSPLNGLPPHEVVRRGVVLIPEGRRLFSRMTVFENLLVAANHPEAKAKRAETIEEVMHLFPKLKERRWQLAGTLSGGEQQMVAIGRSLMSCPKVLLMDEPSLGLAPVVVKEMFTCIASLKKKDITILLVEQNVTDSLAMCDYAYVIENGLIRFQGTREEFQDQEILYQTYMGL